MSDLYAALEIGTTRTVLAVGETDGNGRLKITSHAEIPSTGVRKSQILDITQATQSIRSVLQKTEKLQDENGSKVTIGNVFLAVSGQHIKSDSFFGSVQVEKSRVGNEDMNAVLNSARTMTLPKDRELLDIVDQDYVLDNRGGISAPLGMAGSVLKLNTLQIHADRNRIMDARTAAEAAHLEIREPLFAITCAADAVLQDHEKKNGSLVIDLGGGSTGYAFYCDGYVVATGVIGVGGDHITNDIAHAFQTTNAQAEGLKINSACAIIRSADGEPARVRVEQGENTLMDNRTISRRALDTVVNARLMELFTVIRETLEDQDILHRLHSGIVLTGGGARLREIDTLAEQILGSSVRIGRPLHIDGLENEDFPAAYATIAGALLYACRNYEEKSAFGGLFERLFK